MNDIAQFGLRHFRHLPLSRLIQFGDHLLVDYPPIDAQHKAIFDVGVRLFEEWRVRGGRMGLRPQVEKLSNLMHSHFNFEEPYAAGSALKA